MNRNCLGASCILITCTLLVACGAGSEQITASGNTSNLPAVENNVVDSAQVPDSAAATPGYGLINVTSQGESSQLIEEESNAVQLVTTNESQPPSAITTQHHANFQVNLVSLDIRYGKENSEIDVTIDNVHSGVMHYEKAATN